MPEDAAQPIWPLSETVGDVLGLQPGAAAIHCVQIVASTLEVLGGTSVAVTRLAEAVAGQGAKVDLMSLGEPRAQVANGVRALTFRRDFASVPVLGQLYLSHEMRQAVDEAARGGALIHTHGMWLMPNVMPAAIARRRGAPLVFSTHGMMDPVVLEYSRVRKGLFLRLFQQRALDSVDCFHATSAEEVQHIRRFGLKQPIAVIPNGIDIPELEPRTLDSPPERTILYLGRIHPKKGIDLLIRAWAAIESRWPDWRLRIVGPSERQHDVELKRLAQSLGVQRVSFEPGVFGADRDAALRAADVFVLPTLSENFGLVVGEALAQETPVICTKGAPWQGLQQNRCGWWIDHDPDVLAATLEQAASMPRPALQAMGARGRAWMARDFSWSTVGAQMLAVYRWRLGKAERPGHVEID